MLLPIKLASCHPSLSATRDLQIKLIKWLCDQNRSAEDITEPNIRMLARNDIVGEWLVRLSQRTHNKQPLISCMRILASLNSLSKQEILEWLEAVDSIQKH